MMAPVLTIDGPSGAGKGTVSRAIAKRLGWNYLDSGSIYRALAIAVLQNTIDVADEVAVTEMAKSMQLAFDCGDELLVKLNGVDITHQLGTETTGNTASVVAAYPSVRAALLQKQKDFRQMPGLVADGRDMGSVVFPDAPYKIYLTATAEQRASRRYKQLIEKGINANLDQITREIEERDLRDKQRATAPLVIPEGALVIDSSPLTIEQVIGQVMALIQ